MTKDGMPVKNLPQMTIRNVILSLRKKWEMWDSIPISLKNHDEPRVSAIISRKEMYVTPAKASGSYVLPDERTSFYLPRGRKSEWKIWAWFPLIK